MKELLLLLLVVLIPLNGCASSSLGRPSSPSSGWIDIPSPHASEAVRRSLEGSRYESIRVHKTDGTLVVLRSPVLHGDTVLSGDGHAFALNDIERWQVPEVTVGGVMEEAGDVVKSAPWGKIVPIGLLVGVLFWGWSNYTGNW